jgi:RHS repeat-associated protein
VASYHLDPWGNFRFPQELDSSKNRFAFTGHIWDEETGLYNAKARYFDPKLGRFLTQDSFLGQIDEPPSLHRYLYANANPTFYIDPTGHYSWSEFKSDATWTKDFIVAAGSDLAQNAPDRVVRTVGATFDQAGNLAVQTAAMAHDTAVLGADAAARATTGEGFDNVSLYSQLAQSSAQRLGQGESLGDIIKDGAFEMGANALTVGTYGTFKEQFSTAADYLSGNASIEQVESRLINAAAAPSSTLRSAPPERKWPAKAGWASQSRCRHRPRSSRALRNLADGHDRGSCRWLSRGRSRDSARPEQQILWI